MKFVVVDALEDSCVEKTVKTSNAARASMQGDRAESLPDDLDDHDIAG